MMKKAFSLLVALMVMISMAGALAAEEVYTVVEDFDTFDVSVKIPEGMILEQLDQEGWINLRLSYNDETKPIFFLNITPTEEYTGLSFGDLDQDEQDLLKALVLENFAEPVQSEFTTPSGNLIVQTEEKSDMGNYVTMETIYRGFYFYLYCAHEDFAEITADDIAVMHQITEGLEIVSTGEPEMPTDEMLQEAEAEASQLQ